MALRGVGAGEGGDFGALSPINDDGAAGAGSVVETGEAGGRVGIAPGSDGVVIDSQGGGDGSEGLAAVEFEQGGGAFEGFDGERAFGEQLLQRGAVGVREG